MPSPQLEQQAIRLALELKRIKITQHNDSIANPVLSEGNIKGLADEFERVRKAKIAQEAKICFPIAIAVGTLYTYSAQNSPITPPATSIATPAITPDCTTATTTTPSTNLEEHSFTEKVKVAFHTWSADGMWRHELQASGIRMAKGTIISAIVSAAQYVILNAKILIDKSFELANRIGKFISGLLYVTGWNSLKAGLLTGLIELIARMARIFFREALKFVIPVIGPLITTIISIVNHIAEKASGKLTGAQLTEWIIIDIIQGIVYGLISLLPPVINIAVGCVVALTLGTLLSYLGAKQNELQNGVSIRSLGYTWIKSVFVTVVPPDPHEVFCCCISLQCMNDPAVLYGIYYDYKHIEEWVKKQGKDPIFSIECKVADIKRCTEMSRFIAQYIYAYNC